MYEIKNKKCIAETIFFNDSKKIKTEKKLYFHFLVQYLTSPVGGAVSLSTQAVLPLYIILAISSTIYIQPGRQ